MVCVKTSKKTWKVLLRNSPETSDPQHLQRAVDFVSAFIKGFNLQDALAIVRIDGIYVESFHIADVRQRLRVGLLQSWNLVLLSTQSFNFLTLFKNKAHFDFSIFGVSFLRKFRTSELPLGNSIFCIS